MSKSSARAQNRAAAPISQAEPLAPRTTPSNVYQVLRTAILNHDMQAGEQLREEHIAAQLGISRAPLRESLTRLEEEGLIVKIPFRGAFVAEVDAETISEIATVRLLIEPHAAALAAPTLRANDGQLIEQTLRDLRDATTRKDLAGSVDAHMAFHRLFYELSGNSVMSSLWHGWESRLRLFFGSDHQRFETLDQLAAVHEDLGRLVLADDMDQFAARLKDHIHWAPGEAIGDYTDGCIAVPELLRSASLQQAS